MHSSPRTYFEDDIAEENCLCRVFPLKLRVNCYSLLILDKELETEFCKGD